MLVQKTNPLSFARTFFSPVIMNISGWVFLFKVPSSPVGHFRSCRDEVFSACWILPGSSREDTDVFSIRAGKEGGDFICLQFHSKSLSFKNAFNKPSPQPVQSNQTMSAKALSWKRSWILVPCRNILYNKQGYNWFFRIIFRLNRDQGPLLLNCCILRTVLTFRDPRRKAKRTRHIGSRTRQQLRLRTDAEALLTHNPSWTNIARVRLQGEQTL